MTTAKVTQLRDHIAKVPPKRDEQRLKALSRRFLDQLPPLLDGYFTAADDFLFQWAEKTRDGMESSAYFEHLRALRLEKDAIRETILKEMDQMTDRQINGYYRPGKSVRSVSVDELSLMEDDTLERGLAIDSFANRVMERSGNEWLAFRERLGILTQQRDLKDEETPFNAQDFGKVVFDALGQLQCPLKTILMLFRLFDQKACAQLTVYYQSSNRWMVDEGILPNLKLMNARADAPVNPETFEQLGQMLAQKALSGLSSGNYTGGQGGGGYAGGGSTGGQMGGGVGSPHVGGGVTVDAGTLQHLLGTLSQIQTQVAPATTDVAALKTWAQSQAQAITTEARGTEDAGTISLVAMLFEYILDDQYLSPHMKQLMARMQIPIIKVALLDKSFFTNADHSARRLLNRMAKAATGWEPTTEIEDDILLEGMETIVTRLNRDFETDLTMFDAALDEFMALKEEYEALQSARLAVLQTEEAAKLEAHENQDRAHLFIQTLLKDEVPPTPVLTLLQRHWYRLMKGILKTQGEGKAWKTSARIARELMWSIQPNVQLTEGTRFNKVVPSLLSGLRNGLKALGVGEEERDRLIAGIETVHAGNQQKLSEDVWEAQSRLDAFEERSRKAEAIVEEPQPLPVDEPVIQHKPADLTYYMDVVEQLPTDSWFDIELKEGKTQRGCLSCILGSGSKFIFTDYKGEKIAERSGIGLAMAIRDDTFRPLDQAPLFDRMIETLVSDLGKSKTRH